MNEDPATAQEREWNRLVAKNNNADEIKSVDPFSHRVLLGKKKTFLLDYTDSEIYKSNNRQQDRPT